MLAFGISIGTFIIGMRKADYIRLSIAFIFLGLAWLYREMYLRRVARQGVSDGTDTGVEADCR